MGVFVVIFAGLVGTVSTLIATIGLGVGFGGAVATYFLSAGAFLAVGLSRPAPVMRNLSAEEQIAAWQHELGFDEEAASSEKSADDETRAA